jgi:putative transposase
MAESVNGLCKAELVRWEGPWRNASDLELATLGYLDWFNNTRIHSAFDYRTPAEVEAEYYSQQAAREHTLVG